jgi:hypothetical protein
MVSIVQPFHRDTTMKHFTNAVNLSDTSVISPDLTKTRVEPRWQAISAGCEILGAIPH